VRTPHATTTLIRTGKRNILVDPGLPDPIIAARLYERTGLNPGQIDTVFLTNLRPAHRAGIRAFASAKIMVHEPERDAIRPQLEQMREAVGSESDDAKVFDKELAILEAIEPASDKIAPGIDIFPLPGFTPGTCGLLISLPSSTILIAGDAVPTQEHFLAMQVLPESYDARQAGESMREAYEIADLIIPGHDNVFMNPRTQGM
jgi:glyoxylase-like metal-dependent hydrolase (beta-lactamase superfamily II)